MNISASVASLKTTFFPVLIAVVICCSCNPDSKKEPATKISENDPVAETAPEAGDVRFLDTIGSIESIKEEYAKTNHALDKGILDSTAIGFNCYEEETGTVTYYHYEGEIRLVEKHYGAAGHRSASEQYFIADGKPYFIFYEITDWHFVSPTQKPREEGQDQEMATVDRVKEKRYYILEDTLAICLNKEYEIHSASDKIPDPDQVANERTSCPALQPLLEEYELLISHKDDTSAVKCL